MKVILLLTLILSGLYALVPWEWAMMDDTNFIFQLKAMTDAHGLLSGVLHNIIHLYRNDVSWGLFRPSWWFYASTFYLFPTSIAHYIRFWMIVATVLLPLLALTFKRRKEGLPAPSVFLLACAAGLLLSNRALYEGFSYPSLQEIGGILFICLGATIFSSRERSSNTFLALICFLLAAWFKAPFIWFVFCFSAGLIFFDRENRVLGFLGTLAGLVNLFIVVTWARQGTYTSRFQPLSLSSALTTLHNMSKPVAYAVVVMVVWLLVSRGELIKNLPKRNAWFENALIVSGLLYFGNLLPWGAFGYYFSAPLFLVIFGFTLHLSRLPEAPCLRPMAIVSLAIATFVAFKGLGMAHDRDVGIRTARDFALNIPYSGLTIGVNGEEYTERFNQLMQLRTSDAWKNNTVFLDERKQSHPKLDYYVITYEAGYDESECAEVLTRYKLGMICRGR